MKLRSKRFAFGFEIRDWCLVYVFLKAGNGAY